MLVLLGFTIGAVLFGPAAYQWWTNDGSTPVKGEGERAAALQAKKRSSYRPVIPQRRGSYSPPGAVGMGGMQNPPIYDPRRYQPSIPDYRAPVAVPPATVPYSSGGAGGVNIGGYRFRNPEKDRGKRHVPYRSRQLAEDGYPVPQWPQGSPDAPYPMRPSTQGSGWAGTVPDTQYPAEERVTRRWSYQQPRFRPLDHSRSSVGRYTGGGNIGTGQPRRPLPSRDPRHLWTYENGDISSSPDNNALPMGDRWQNDSVTRY